MKEPPLESPKALEIEWINRVISTLQAASRHF